MAQTPIDVLNIQEARMAFLKTLLHYEKLKFDLRNNSHMIATWADSEVKSAYEEIVKTLQNLELLSERIEELS